MSDTLTPEERADLRIALKNVDTGACWKALGNTLYYGSREDEFIAIPGGVILCQYFAAAQPKLVRRLLDALEEAERR